MSLLPSNSDSESDAPETIPLTQAKKLSRQHNAQIRKAGALARERTKSGHREKDRKLKERAVENKGHVKKEGRKAGEGVVEKDQGDEEKLEGLKMVRFTMDVEDEGEFSGSGVEDMDHGESGSESSGMEDLEEVQDVDSDSNYEDESMSSEPDLDLKTGPVKNPANYLPDEVFRAAFTQSREPQASDSQKARPSKQRHGKRKRPGSTPKDVIIGSRAIRTLPSTTRPLHTSSTVPSSKINKFLNRTLALKGQHRVPGKTWERKPANIGVLRRNGPAAHFVRKR